MQSFTMYTFFSSSSFPGCRKVNKRLLRVFSHLHKGYSKHFLALHLGKVVVIIIISSRTFKDSKVYQHPNAWLSCIGHHLLCVLLQTFSTKNEECQFFTYITHARPNSSSLQFLLWACSTSKNFISLEHKVCTMILKIKLHLSFFYVQPVQVIKVFDYVILIHSKNLMIFILFIYCFFLDCKIEFNYLIKPPCGISNFSSPNDRGKPRVVMKFPLKDVHEVWNR